ncbi:MAG: hypothetical protein N2C14_28130, partial [Planctomycetales bacterium]
KHPVTRLVMVYWRILIARDELEFLRQEFQTIERLPRASFYQASDSIAAWRANASSTRVFYSLSTPDHWLGEAAEADAHRRLAVAALAAKRFQIEQGRYPQGWKELVPKYLPAVPTDPFDGKPMRFMATPKGLVLYSVAYNLSDDSGFPITQQSGNAGDLVFRLGDAWEPDLRDE